MYPTRSNMLDYMTEMNRLFPRSNENDMLLSPATPNTSLRSFNQSGMARSSSSTDTSTDSFPDMTAHRFLSEPIEHQYKHHDNLGRHRPQFDIQPHQYENQKLDQYESYMPSFVPFVPQQMYETPLGMRRQRPIVGRKIMAAESQSTENIEVFHCPEKSLLHTPPHSFAEQKVNQKVYYELFPAENKEVEFKTPTKPSPNSFTTSPKLNNMSPSMVTKPQRMTEMSGVTNMSQRMTEMYPTMNKVSPIRTATSPRMTEIPPSRTISPGSSTSPYSQRFSTPTFKEPVGPNTSSWYSAGPSKMCTFCRKNGETPLVYMTHAVKEKMGNKTIVTCPILRSHVCATCGASGDDAHTITYCPVLRSSNNGQPLQSTTITLKSTRVKSNGRRRY